MGFLGRILRQGRVGEAANKAKGGAIHTGPGPAAAPAPPRLLYPSGNGDDSDDSDDDMVTLPNMGGPLLSEPVFAPRRGALDMGGDSLSDSCANQARCSGVAPAGRLSGASLGGSEIEALYTDLVLTHRGRHAMIYRARERRSRRRVVLKAYLRQHRNPTRAAALEREQRMLRLAAPHAGIVALERVLENADATYLVLEAGAGGTLMEAIANSGGHLPERIAARRVAGPLLRALAHLHARGVVHRDLKPEHVLIANDGVRVADFSSAACLPNAPPARPPLRPDISQRAETLRRSLELLHARHHRQTRSGPPTPDKEGGKGHQQQHQQEEEEGERQQQQEQQQGEQHHDVLNYRVGSMEYMAPEMLAKPTAAEVFHLVIAHGMDEEELPVYDEKVDIWSVGALLFEALTGFQPFLADGAAEMAAAVAARLADRDPETGLPVFLSRQPALSADAKDFIARCLEARPEARPSAAELLAHPWLERRGSLGEALSQAVHPQPGQKTPMNRCLSEAAIAPATGHMADSDPGVVLGPLEGLHRSPLLRAGSDADLLHRSKAGPLADE